jgi:hypothetical protein
VRMQLTARGLATLSMLIIAFPFCGWAQDASQPAPPAKLRLGSPASQDATNQDGASGSKLRITPGTPTQAPATPAPIARAESKPVETEAATLPTPEGLADYSGTMDARQVRFTLVTKPDGSVTGSYFLSPDFTDISIEGHSIDAQSLSLREVRTEATANASIYLKRVANGDGFTGVWTSHDGKTSLPLTLQMQDALPGVDSVKARYNVTGAQDAAALEKNAQVFYAAVVANSPEQAAAAVAFPLAYTANGHRTLLHTPAEFTARYSSIFTPQFLEQIRNATPHQMFANSQGVMLGSGLVWFNEDGKAFALNNEPVKMFAGKHFMTNAGWKGAASVGNSDAATRAPATATHQSQSGMESAGASKTPSPAGAIPTTTNSKTRRRHHGKRSKAAATPPGQ